MASAEELAHELEHFAVYSVLFFFFRLEFMQCIYNNLACRFAKPHYRLKHLGVVMLVLHRIFGQWVQHCVG